MTPIPESVDVGNAIYKARKAGATELELALSIEPRKDALCDCGHTYFQHEWNGHECGAGGCHCATFTHEDVTLDVVFDGPPSHEGGRFVECEANGRSVRAGEWIDRGDGYWALRLRVSPETVDARTVREIMAKYSPVQPVRCPKCEGIDQPGVFHSINCPAAETLSG